MYLPPSYTLFKKNDSLELRNVVRGIISLIFFDIDYYQKSYPDLKGIKTE